VFQRAAHFKLFLHGPTLLDTDIASIAFADLEGTRFRFRVEILRRTLLPCSGQFIYLKIDSLIFTKYPFMNWQRHRMLRLVRARPRIFIAAVAAVAVGLLLPTFLVDHLVTRLLVAWNVGTCFYVLLAAIMMTRSSHNHMRRRAQLQDDGEVVILILVVISAVASLAAIAAELAVVKDMHGLVKVAHITLAGLTVISSWAFIQIMFALHYAHDYYAALSQNRPKGIQFPEDEQPDYGDFFYFAAIIGTSGQTADVSFTSKSMRRIGSVHCILAYLFNTTVLALLINIGASLF
jgi:uncharacterized membrane protein